MTISEKDIEQFLNKAGWGAAKRVPLSGDASFRSYERLHMGNDNAVLMLAPPEKENTKPFIAVAEHLLKGGYSAPKIIAKDTEAGLLLLEDFGDKLLTKAILESPNHEEQYYALAVELLVHMQKEPTETNLPQSHELQTYEMELFQTELSLFSNWYLREGLNLKNDNLEQEWQKLWEPILNKLETPNILTMRDYHAENIIILDKQKHIKKIGLLDFQDAVVGHRAYDLVSLLSDARRDVPLELEHKMINHFIETSQKQNIKIDHAAFIEEYNILGAQRNAKIIGIFTRLWKRDGKENYPTMIPHVWKLLERNLTHPSLKPVKVWLDKIVPTHLRQTPLKTMQKDKPANLPDHAMVLAAGLGKRMRGFSSTIPKPMVQIAGKSLINRVLDKLNQAGVNNAVVNLHYKAEQIKEHIAKRKSGPAIKISSEEGLLLETGGGVKNALPLLGQKQIFVINSDALWQDNKTSNENSLHALGKAWDGDKMDALLLLMDTSKLANYSGSGDFHMDDSGALSRPNDGHKKPYIFIGVQIISPKVFDDINKEVFSLNDIYDKAIKRGRLFGAVHGGTWHHVGTAEEVEIAEKFYSKI